MSRALPDLNNSILIPLFGKAERTPEEYLDRIQKFERRVETSFIEVLKA
jgi:hypothetical protein